MWRFLSSFFPQPPQPKPEGDLPPAKVAIIGAGVGGCFAAKFLRENGGKQLDIHVFAKKESEVGGRVGVCRYDGHLFESGAYYIHPDSKYQLDAAREYGLTTRLNGVSSAPCAFYDGRSLFQLSASNFLLNFQLFWRYGFDLAKMNSFIKSFDRDMRAIYPLQENGRTFTNVEDMLTAMGGPQFCNLMKVSAYEYMRKDLHWNDTLVDEVVGAPVRLYYGQSTSVNALTAGVSISYISNDNLWRVVGGNCKIAESALQASGSSLVKEDVVSVTKTEEGGSAKYTIVTADGKTDEGYDVVIVANPLNTSSIEYINFSRNVYTEAATKPYQRMVATFCKGKINGEFFGEKADSPNFPRSILVTNMDALPFGIDALGVVDAVDTLHGEYVPNEPMKVWEVLTAEPLTREQSLTLFPDMDPDNTVAYDWLGFPQYTEPYQAPSFVLDDGVFYINAIEMAVSIMEMAIISAKNAALLSREYILHTNHED